MKSQPMSFIATCLLAAWALPIQVAAQSNYIFTEVQTFGGPNTSANQTGAKNNLLNAMGTLVGGADTSILDPYCPGGPICFASHAFAFRHGVLKDLGALPGGFNSEAFWVNNSGMAAGFSEIGVIDPLIPNFLELRAVVWQNGKAVEIGTFGGNDSMAQAVNSRGQVVGFALNSTPDAIEPLPWPTEMRAFLWDNGVMQNLGTLGGPDSWAFFVNDSGQVAGISYPDSSSISGCDTPGKNHGFLWENGHMKDVGTLGGSCSWPEGLSNQGRIVGWSNMAGDTTQHPFLWDGTTLLDLGTLGGSSAYATWINDNGEVTGVSFTENDETFLAFAWKNSVITPLPRLPGDCASDAKRNNSKGQIIGISYACDFSSSRGVLWENGTVTDLNAFVPPQFDFVITGDVMYMNDRGDIAGNGVTPNGDIHFFTLTPVSGSATASASAAVADLHTPSRNAVHTKLDPDVLAKLRARITPHRGIPGLPSRN
jgi:probable HAF family extracellular repeat protein